MKRKIAYLVATIAMMATGMASLGCWWALMEEPMSLRYMSD